MEATPHCEEANREYNREFKWGESLGDGGTDNQVQFCKSFTYDGVEYKEYDCVYLHVENGQMPNIGKLVKIWELQDHRKYIRVIWFFQPTEILDWLGDDAPLKNEIFLACGRGKGLSNDNPLEVLVGKCNVVCTSKDRRNPQPSDIEVRMADYVFYRTFDVAKCKISDRFEDKIGSTEVRHFFNVKCHELISDKKLGLNRNDKWITDTSSKLDLPEAVDTMAKDGKPGVQTNPSVKGAESKRSIANASDQGHISDERISPKSTTFGENATKTGNIPSGQVVDKRKLESIQDSYHLEASDCRPFKRMEFIGESAKRSGVSPSLPREESNTNILQKPRVGLKESVEKSPGSFLRVSPYKAKSEARKDLVGKDRMLSMVSSGDKSTKISGKADSKLAEEKGIKTQSQVIEVTRRPDADRSKWFKQLPWEEAIQKGHEQGTLVLLRNLDPCYTSAEVEDIVLLAFKERCTAKMIQHNAFSSPHYGEAYVIFETRDAAEMAIRKLERGCLMLPNGRPLVGCKHAPTELGMPPNFFGHLSIKGIKHQKQRQEKRDAVSTSHFSQANTIEYDLALEWCFLQQRSEHCWKALYEEHEKELLEIWLQLKNP